MDFALHAALLGAVMGSAILAVSTIYGWTLPAAPRAYGWWAAAFVLETLSKGVLLGGASPFLTGTADLFHGLSAGLVFCGAWIMAGRSLSAGIMASGLVAAAIWTAGAHQLRLHLGLVDLPLFGIGGLPMLFAGVTMLTRSQARSDGHRIAALSFTLSGLHQLASPVLHTGTTLATFSFVFAQALSMVMAVALLLVVVRRQQARAESEGQRANLLQSRLVDALGSVQDGVALYDKSDRLVTSNVRYREFLDPVKDLMTPGRSFEEIIRAQAARGVVVAARGQEERWVSDVLADHTAFGTPVEQQLWDGRWVAVSVYRTADGGHLRILRDVTIRKQAETALAESVAWLRGIMDTVVDGLITIDDTGTVLSYNPAAERIFGYGAEEVVGRNVNMLMPEPYRSDHDDYLSRYRLGGEARMVGIGRQVEGRRKDGAVFPLELAVTEMRQGDMVTFIGVVRDITDRKRVENALLDSEQRFRDLAESASDWFWEADEQMVFTFVSGRVRQILGVGPGFFLGRSFSDLGAMAENPTAWEDQRTLMERREAFRGFVFLHATPSGRVKFVEMAGRPAYDTEDVFRGYRGTATDITPIKRHEQDLAAQAAMRQSILDNMAQGVVVFDGAGVMVAMNQHARRLLDMPAETSAGRDEMMARLSMPELPDDPAGPYVFEHARPDGGVLEVRSTAMPGGGLILTFTDITERKRFEGTLRDAKDAAERGHRAKATFLANISHELRTPLNAIIGFSELMMHEIFGPLEPASYRNYVTDIHESGMHLLELINDILDMSKAEAGMTDLLDSEVDVAALGRAALRMMQRRADAHQVELADDVADALPRLRADERRLRQILLNLLSNAVKFTEAGGRVTLAMAVDDRGFVITVADTGIGMTPEDLERVMEPFVQADTRLSRKYEGTGLGLPLSRALAEAHGGTLVLDSQPERGTTATVVFPPSRIVTPIPAGDPAVSC